MSEQPTFPQMAGPALVVGPVFVAFEYGGKPRPKGRHRSRLVTPREKFSGVVVDVTKSAYELARQFAALMFIHQYPDPETEAYEEALKWVAKGAMKGRAPSEKPLALLVHVFKEIPVSWSKRDREAALLGGLLPVSKPDWDNYGKITDALNEIIWKDDSQVCDGRVIKRYSNQPALRIEVREFVAP